MDIICHRGNPQRESDAYITEYSLGEITVPVSRLVQREKKRNLSKR